MPIFHPDLAARPVPRYTSYPTADRFTEDVGAAEQVAALSEVPPGTPVSFYVHIPYCHEICWYCGCNTGAIGRPDRLEAYARALEMEIDQVAERMSGQLGAIHFGGGTPTVLPAKRLVGLIERLRSRFGRSTTVPVSVELDPRSCEAATIAALARAGVTRLSLGVQTFSSAVQRRIHRVQSFDQVSRIVSAARDAGIASINFDLLYGLPDQSIADIEETAALALSLAPDRIAAFGYAHLPRAIPRQRMIEDALLPDGEARFAQSAAIHRMLTCAGYAAIGFDHFARREDSLAIAARSGRLRRNFQGFTDERCEVVVGLGASAISQFPDLLIQNEKHVGRYREAIEAGRPAGTRGIRRDDEARRRWSIIERLLCEEAVDLMDARTLAGHGLDALDELRGRGLIEVEGRCLRIAEAGRPYARLVAACFDPLRSTDGARSGLGGISASDGFPRLAG